MNVTERKLGGVVILTVEGSVTRDRVRSFGSQLRLAIGGRWARRVLLDGRDMTYIDCAGLREILFIAKRIASHRGRFAVCGLAEGPERVFQAIGFDRIVAVHDFAHEALAALSSATD